MELAIRSNSRSFDLLKRYITSTTGLSLNAIVQSTLRFIKDHLDINHSSIALLEPGGTRVKISAINHDNDLDLEAGDILVTNETVLPEIVNNRKSLYRPDISSITPKYAVDEKLIEKGLRSDFIVPLWFEDQCLGTLNVGSKEIDGISAEARQVITLIAPSLAQSVQNSTLFNTLETSESKYRRIVEVLRDDYFSMPMTPMVFLLISAHQ